MLIGKKYTLHKEAEDGTDGGGDDAIDKANEKPEGDDGTKPDVEAEARKMGWTPKDEFRGDPEKWRGADEFVERGRTMLPIVRKTVERQERQIAELRQTITDLAAYNTKAEKQAFERALKELKAEQVAAVKAGDADAFVEVDEKIADLHKEAREKPQIKVPQPGEDPEYLEWVGRNKWVDTDKEASIYATHYAGYLRESGDKRVGAIFLDDVAKAVKEKFPDKFKNPRREAPGAVESGAQPAKRGGGKTYADLPADARAACDRMARNGYADKPKEMAEFKANYVKNFFEEA